MPAPLNNDMVKSLLEYVDLVQSACERAADASWASIQAFLSLDKSKTLTAAQRSRLTAAHFEVVSQLLLEQVVVEDPSRPSASPAAVPVPSPARPGARSRRPR